MAKEPLNSFADRLIRIDEPVEFIDEPVEFIGEKDCPSCGFVMTKNACCNFRCVDFHDDGN